jgi:quinol monooxygenase YgiN
MYIVHVFCEVKPDQVAAFRQACVANASASVREPGIARFDVLQDSEQPERFLLVEVYRTKDDPAWHRETEHYKLWKQTVAEMMAAPRTKQIYDNVFPDEYGWE